MFKFGKIFSDNILLYRKKRVSRGVKLTGWGARMTLFYLFLILGTFFLIVRLFHLTIVKGPENRNLSQNNRIRSVIIHAPRGIFYDRLDTPLVKNINAIKLENSCPKDAACGKSLLSETEFEKKSLTFKNVFFEKDFIREYLYPEATSHLLGYLSEITSDEINNPYFIYQDYVLGDRIGRMGLEEEYDKNLRGKNGKELLEIDATGNISRSLGRIEPVTGAEIRLSIDIGLQQVAYTEMIGKKGAVVVAKPATGEILALVSAPAFNPNTLHSGLTTLEYSQLLDNTDRILFNRAVSGVYPPGSTFKIISAIAGLETKTITKDTLIEDTGNIQIGQFGFGNWYFRQYGKTEGMVDIVKAIARSNDIFFYKLGEMVTIEKLADWGRKFGVGDKTGIELTNEAEGIMPDRVWRKKVKGENWYLGDTYHVVIGQGELQTTPLQVNMWTNAVANGGKLCKPTLISQKTILSESLGSGIKTQSLDIDRNKKSRNCTDLEISKETISVVTDGMFHSCDRGDNASYQGTGWPLFDFSVTQEKFQGDTGFLSQKKIAVACKTGTAEFGDPDNKTHAWFTAFAPLPAEILPKKSGLAEEVVETRDQVNGEPEISITVLIEGGGEGSSIAGPIAKKILEEWFKR